MTADKPRSDKTARGVAEAAPDVRPAATTALTSLVCFGSLLLVPRCPISVATVRYLTKFDPGRAA